MSQERFVPALTALMILFLNLPSYSPSPQNFRMGHQEDKVSLLIR